jgi:hypothetical protein
MRTIRLLVLSTLLLAGCATEPWVKPYEREMLADPIMSFVTDPAGQKFRQHVYDVLQGSHGAELSQGGGCGCK